MRMAKARRRRRYESSHFLHAAEGQLHYVYVDPHNAAKARMKLHNADLSDASSLRRWVDSLLPDEVYNLVAQSHVAVSFESEASPYAAAKVAAHWYTVNYRETYGLFACNGILFNHESPRRGQNFVTRMITRAVGRIRLGLQTNVFLGNLSPARDWGFDGDYVEAMWMRLQQDAAGDYVVATEEEFLQAAFGYVGLDWKDHVVMDPKYFRPAEVDSLRSDSTKARKTLGWKPKVGFQELVKMMVDHDLEIAEREKVLVDAGYIDAQQQP
ncbi:hypothetical protein C4D60_Mb11t06400 [Musa balbisiana]|uniref:GDP-mannose 4,6-dehydratase n=1 Tax=Musa balbisiana TaxID=52838 RepID=A0A4S8J2B1_MUSBA|nr:hypothetical protein C4D60_Mb11t06400 [Musa balbisiana]